MLKKDENKPEHSFKATAFSRMRVRSAGSAAAVLVTASLLAGILSGCGGESVTVTEGTGSIAASPSPAAAAYAAADYTGATADDAYEDSDSADTASTADDEDGGADYADTGATSAAAEDDDADYADTGATTAAAEYDVTDYADTGAASAAAEDGGAYYTGAATASVDAASSGIDGKGIAAAPIPESHGDDAPAATTSKAAGTDTAASEESAAGDTSSDSTTSSAASAASAEDEHPAGTGKGIFSAEGKGLVIVIDPGHSSQVSGKTEPLGPGSEEMADADTTGTYGNASGLHEYELAMQVSRKLKNELSRRGYTVKLTHSSNENPIGCVERAGIANENKADAYLRIHANGSNNPDANGAMTICISKKNPFHPELADASIRLSEVLLESYCEKTGAKKESVWQTDTLSGNNWAEVPTTMIELGYMTNPDEDLKMAMDSYQIKMAGAIADGLDQWFDEMPEEELAAHPALSGSPQNDTRKAESNQ